MALLGYNRRLIWVIIPLVLWAMLGLLLAAGAGARDGAPPPLNLQVNLPDGGIWLRGQLLSIAETEAGLTVRVAVRHGEVQPLDAQHANLVIEQVEMDHPRWGQPEIAIAGNEAVQLPNGRGAALTEHYLIRFSPGDVRIIPRPADLTSEHFRRMLRQQLRDRDDRRLPRDGPWWPRPDDQPPGSQSDPPPRPKGRPVRDH